jgi:hypothetical protein
MKIALGALLLTIWLLQTPATKNHNGQATANNSSQSRKTAEIEEARPRPSVIHQTVYNCEPSKPEDKTQTAKAVDQSHHWIERVNAISTVIIALFAVVTAVAVLVQVQSARNTDRAWIIVSPTDATPEIGFIPNPGDPLNTPGRDKPNIFTCSIKNTGNTPARLVNSAVIYRKIDRLEDIPKEPQYGQRGPFGDFALVKEDSMGAVAFLQPDVTLTRSEASAVQAQQCFLYAYGVVSYRDVFGRSHETRFGYVYHAPLGGDPIPRGFRREKLPLEYNRAT